jgi:hypothetical protein
LARETFVDLITKVKKATGLMNFQIIKFSNSPSLPLRQTIRLLSAGHREQFG